MARSQPLRHGFMFLAITLGLSLFVFWGPLALLRVQTISFVDDSTGPIWAIVLFMIGGFTPSLTAIAMTWIIDGKGAVGVLLRRVVQVRFSPRWYLGAIAVVAAGTAGQILIAQLSGSQFDFSLFAAQLGSLAPLVVLGPLSEEVGWRGFAQDRLQPHLGALATSVIIGMVWGLWHLPLFYIVGSSQSVLGLPFPSFLLGTIAMSVVYTWLYSNTNRSIFSAVFLHWIYTYSLQVVASGVTRSALYNWLEYVPYVIIAAIIVAVWGPRRLSRRHDRPVATARWRP